jgi:hypothetical protein
MEINGPGVSSLNPDGAPRRRVVTVVRHASADHTYHPHRTRVNATTHETERRTWRRQEGRSYRCLFRGGSWPWHGTTQRRRTGSDEEFLLYSSIGIAEGTMRTRAPKRRPPTTSRARSDDGGANPRRRLFSLSTSIDEADLDPWSALTPAMMDRRAHSLYTREDPATA